MPFPIILSALAFGGKFGLDVFAAEQQKYALDRIKLENEIVADQQAIKRADQLTKIISAQRAEGASRGISLDSSSLKAITLNTFNEYAEDEKAAKLNLELKEQAIDYQKQTVSLMPFANATTNLFNALDSYGYYDYFRGSNKNQSQKQIT
jgi:hypothetical protein